MHVLVLPRKMAGIDPGSKSQAPLLGLRSGPGIELPKMPESLASQTSCSSSCTSPAKQARRTTFYSQSKMLHLVLD
jgi:hypothetical protein